MLQGLQKQQRVLTKEKQRIEKQIADQEAKSHDLQMLKFGQEVDIDSLDQSTASTVSLLSWSLEAVAVPYLSRCRIAGNSKNRATNP